MRRTLLFVAFCLYSSSMLAQQCPAPGPTNWCSGLYQYDGMGNIKAIGADVYHYDALGRLVDGTADVQRSGVYSRQDYTYDPFGNRTDVSRVNGSVGCVGGCEVPLTVSPVTNHITSNSAQYDDAGNLTYIQTTVGNTTYPATYTYDGAGSLVRAVASDDREFIYTAGDERIATKNGVNWTWTLRGLDNKVLREYTSMEVNNLPTAYLTWVKDYVWRDGLLLASVAPVAPGSSTTTVQHYHLDHLGTPRVVTNAAGAVIGIHSYYPFGAELDLSPKEPNTEALKFTGHERDTLPGGPLSLDYMHARYEMGTLGRFLSFDTVFSSTVLQLPQAWNRYSYVRSAPMTFIDPSGLDPTCITVKGERKDGKPGTDHIICSESIEVSGTSPSLRLLHGSNGSSGSSGGSATGQSSPFDPKPLPSNCSRIPPAPANANIAANIAEAVAHPGDLLWLRHQVKPHGPWDYKRQDTAAMLTGRTSRYENFGNFHFGVIAAAAGIPQPIAGIGAGIVQGNSQPYFFHPWLGRLGPPYGDDPGDEREIDNGYRFYEQCVARSF